MKPRRLRMSQSPLRQPAPELDPPEQPGGRIRGARLRRRQVALRFVVATPLEQEPAGEGSWQGG